MPNKATERVDLLKTNVEITLGEVQVVTQTMRVARLRAEGGDTVEAEASLKIMRDALDAWREHRQQILFALNEAE
jgi:tryptophan synthase beta subunit